MKAIVCIQPTMSKKDGLIPPAPGACPNARPAAEPIPATADTAVMARDAPAMPTAAYDAAGVFVVFPFETDVSTHAILSLPSCELSVSFALPSRLGMAYATAGMTEAYSAGIT